MIKNNKAFYSIVAGLIIFSFIVIFTIHTSSNKNKSFLKNIMINEATTYFNMMVDTKKCNSFHAEVSNKNNNYFKLTSLKAVNKLDKFEVEALNFFQKNKSENYYFNFSNDLNSFDFMGSLKVEKSCLSCHSDFKEGDLLGGMRVFVPTQKYIESFKEIEDKESHLILLVIVVAAIFILAFIFLVNKLSKRDNEILKNLEEIKQLEKQKAGLLQRYEQAIDGTKDGLWDWDLVKGTIFFSKNWKGMLGYEDDEIKNDLNEWDIRVHPDDKEHAIKDILDNQNKVTDYYQNIHRLKHKNGNWVWILDRGKTYFDENGKAIRMVGFHSNITELKNMEMSLKQAKKELTEFKLIIESAPISIMITDTNAKIIYVNPHFCQVTGYTYSDILGRNPSILKFEDTQEEKEKFENLWDTVLQKKSWGGIFRNKTKAGKEYWETATILPILDSRNNIVNYLGIMREITKEVYLEKELKEKEELMLAQSKNAAMGEMISMIAHQWRQPITTISMSANNIIADIELEDFDLEEIKATSKNIAEQTQFLSKTIDDFRNFFKEGKEISYFKLSEFFSEVSTIMLASLKNNNILLDVIYKEDYELKTYKRELLQVLLNIIKNAKEALCEKGIDDRYIKIEIVKKGSFLEFSILDNGGGIKKANLPKIFNAYFTTKNEYNGTGLGLYMSKIIVEKHLKGSISVSNKEEGANFVLKLPFDVKS